MSIKLGTISHGQMIAVSTLHPRNTPPPVIISSIVLLLRAAAGLLLPRKQLIGTGKDNINKFGRGGSGMIEKRQSVREGIDELCQLHIAI